MTFDYTYPIRNNMEFQTVRYLCFRFVNDFTHPHFGIDDFWMHRLHVIPSLKSWCTGGCSQRGSAGSALVRNHRFVFAASKTYS